MNQTVWIVALSAVAVVSAILSFVAWSRLARPPAALTSEPPDTADPDASLEPDGDTEEAQGTDGA